MKKFISRFCTIFVLLVCVGGISYMIGRTSKEKLGYDPMLTMGIMQTPDVNGIINKIKVENVFIREIYQRQELITMEVDVASEIIYDNSWTEELFKKTQKLVYLGKGKYSTNLNLIEKSDIFFDHENQIVTVAIGKPEISSIEIDELQTLVTPTENGIFRFGEIKLPAADYNRLTLEAKNMMRSEMLGDELMESALTNTANSVKELYGGFLEAAGFSEYTVKILWK